jgi:hypothetical protein
MIRSHIESICQELCRDCITRVVPDEAPLFDTIWQAAKQRMFGGDGVLPPVEWELRTVVAGTPGALSLHGEGESLATISIVSTLCAVVIEAVSSEDRLNQSLDDLLAKYRDTFDTPEWAISHIRSLVQGHIERSAYGTSPRLKVGETPRKPYLIWENQKERYEGTLEDVKRLRQAAQRGDYDIFVDDTEHGVLLIFGKTARDLGARALRPGETASWKTLIALMKRIGSRWTEEDLFAEIEPNVSYKHKPHSGLVYQYVRHVKDVLDESVLKSGRPHTKGLVDSWFPAGQNRVGVSGDLRACLIRRHSTQ